MSFWELIIKGIPEGFLDVLAIYLFTKTKFKTIKYIITTIIFTFITFILKNLLNTGVSTMVSLLVLVLVLVIYNQIEITNAIKSTLIVAIVLIFCESINILILLLIYGDRLKNLTGIQKAIGGIPATIIFATFILAYYYINKKIAKSKKVIDGEVSTKDCK